MTVHNINWRYIIGVSLLLAGAAVLWQGLPDIPAFWHRPFSYSKQASWKPGDAAFPALTGRYPVESVTRYAIEHGAGSILTLHVADYRDADGSMLRAGVYLSDADPTHPVADAMQIRREAWAAAANAAIAHAGPNALFLAGWDNGQRLHFFTGAASWLMLPNPAAWRDGHERRFWQELAGGADTSSKPQQLARWLSMDAEQAIKDMVTQLPLDKTPYWLVTVDDLARLSEIETLAGVSLPLETRLFPQADNLHALIADVKRWALEKGSGNYLVQQIPGYGVRAWRVADAKADNALLVRLLPFTGSIGRLPEGLQAVYQSEQAWLTVYRLAR